MTTPPNFKLIDDIDSGPQQPDTRQYHNFPQISSGMPQFQHMMKRKGEQNKLEEIFGANQNYSRMEQIEAQSNSGLRVAQQPKTVSIPTGNIKQQIQQAISDYFAGFIMTKIRIVGKYAVYKAVANCLLCDGVRFVVAITANDAGAIGSRIPLSQLQWESFQTRFQTDDSEVKRFGIQSFSYTRPTTTILNDKIRLSRQTDEVATYQCDTLPLTIEVLKENKDEYFAESGTVASALELFNTVISG